MIRSVIAQRKALCGMSLKRDLVFIPICDVTINNSDLVVSNLTEKYIEACTVPKYHAAVDYTPRLRASRNLPRCTANSDTYGQ